MIHHPLKSGDDFSVDKSVTKGKFLVQITSNLNRQQARGVFTKEEMLKLLAEIQKTVYPESIKKAHEPYK